MSSSTIPHRRWVPFVLLGAMWLLLALLVIPTWGWTYWDFGDGNYLYIARRVREGLTLYKDILAPQPPLHTLGGVAAESIGAAAMDSALSGVRVYNLLVRMAASLVVMLLAWRSFGCAFRAVASAAIYLSLPIGFWWSLSYQSENLEVVFLVAALFFLISWDKRQAAIAGVFSALACHVNMTAFPYLLANGLFLACRRWQLLPWYLGTGAGVYAAGALAANAWTDGFFVSNVLLNQVGTFPRTDILASSPSGPSNFWEYAWGKIRSQSVEVLRLEAGMILAALAGVLYHVVPAPRLQSADDTEARDDWHRTEFLAWSFIAGLLSICFTAKGGTVNYIFVLGEPLVACFAATALVALFRKSLPSDPAAWKTLSIRDTRVFLRVLFPVLILGVIYVPIVGNIRLTLNQVQAELPENRALELKGFIETYAEPGDTILAPPFYAFMTETNVAAELAENYIWQIKYMNETFDLENYGIPTKDGVEKMQELAGMLERQEVKVVLLDMAQTGRVPAVARAIDQHYQPAEPEPIRTRNTTLRLFVPKDQPLKHVPLTRRD